MNLVRLRRYGVTRQSALLFICVCVCAFILWNGHSARKSAVWILERKVLSVETVTEKEVTSCGTLLKWSPEIIANRPKPAKLKPCPHAVNWLRIFNGKILFQHPRNNLSCTARAVLEKSSSGYEITHGKSVPIGHGDDVPADAFVADCFDKSTNSKQQMLYGGVRRNDKPAKRNYTGPHHNIILLCMDSVSRLEFERSLPKTVAYFKSKNIGGQVLESYNIVGDGTPAALLPILTGKDEEELPEARRGYKGAKPVDDLPWIFKRMHQLGYTSQWFEEQPQYGTFTYRMLGFRKPPVEHYMRSYMLGQNVHGPYQGCVGSELRFERYIHLIKELFRIYPDKPKFSFLHLSLYSHEGGDFSFIDDFFVSFFQWLEQNGWMKNTMLVLFADHGARFSKLRKILQGRLEERLPMMGIALPKNLYKDNQNHQVYKNLKDNVARLTTPYDLHATMHHILNITSDLETSNKGAEVQLGRGASLLKPININRTCADAHITPHWCACSKLQKITNLNQSIVRDSAAAFIDVVNDLTNIHRDSCHLLSVKKIISAHSGSVSESMLQTYIREIDPKVPKTGDLQVGSVLLVLETFPNDALYEVTVYWYRVAHLYGADIRYHTKAGYVSRTNRYGSQPKCLMAKYPHLRIFCFCKKLNSERYNDSLVSTQTSMQ